MMSMKVLLLCLLLCIGSPCAVALSVDEAYRAIPHQQTDFDRHTAQMDVDEALYLDDFFTLVNAAIVERVQALQWLSSGGSAGKTYADYRASMDLVFADFDRLTVPAGVHDVHKQVIAAMRLQSEYLGDWAERTGRGERFRFSASDKRITASSRLLIASYNQLMERYPEASRHNRQAFYDHLCALDFI